MTDDPSLNPAAAETPESPQSISARHERAEFLLREAAVQTRRGDKSAARRAFDEARKLGEDSPVVLEAIGDKLVEDRSFDLAKVVFERAMALDPGNKSAERKHAECVYQISIGSLSMGAMMSEFESSASSRVSLVLSAILPGLGQITTGLVQRGAIMMAIWIVSLFLLFLSPGGLQGILGVLGVGGRRDAPFNGLILVPLFGAIIAYFWSLLDASSRAKGSVKKTISRPVPPVDKDFEL